MDDQTDRTLEAFEAQTMIGQATGLLMGYRGITADEARTLLERHAADHDVPLSDVARQVTEEALRLAAERTGSEVVDLITGGAETAPAARSVRHLLDEANRRDVAAEARDARARARDAAVAADPTAFTAAEVARHGAVDRLHAARDRDAAAEDRSDLRSADAGGEEEDGDRGRPQVSVGGEGADDETDRVVPIGRARSITEASPSTG